LEKILIQMLKRQNIVADRHCLERDAAAAHGSAALESRPKKKKK